MSDPKKIDTTAIAVELLPAAIQAATIVVFLVLTVHDSFETFAAIILSLIWLQLGKSKMPEEFGDLRLRRHLFALVGGWVNQSDAAKQFDGALSQYLAIEGGIENDEHKTTIIAAGIANGFRGVVSMLVQGYLIFVLVVVIVNRLFA